MTDYKTWVDNFTTKLKKALNEAGMTQKELSEKIGSTDASMSRYIAGQRVPKGTTLLRISKVLGVSLEYLMDPEAGKDRPRIEINTIEGLDVKRLNNLIDLAIAEAKEQGRRNGIQECIDKMHEFYREKGILEDEISNELGFNPFQE